MFGFYRLIIFFHLFEISIIKRVTIVGILTLCLMKKLLLPLIVFAFISCSKDKEPEPDLGTEISGTYQATLAEFNGTAVTLPQNGVTIGVKLTKIDNKKADFQITANVNGDITQENGEVVLSKSGNRIEMKAETSDFGYVEGKNMFLDYITDDGSRVKLEANRK